MTRRLTLAQLVRGMIAAGFTHILADDQIPIDIWQGWLAAPFGAAGPPRCRACACEILMFKRVAMSGNQVRENQAEEEACCSRQADIDAQDGVRRHIWTFIKVAAREPRPV